MIRRPPRSTLFPTRRSSDLFTNYGEANVAAYTQGVIPLQREVAAELEVQLLGEFEDIDRKSTRLNSSHSSISYAVFCLKKKKKLRSATILTNTRLLTSALLT